MGKLFKGGAMYAGYKRGLKTLKAKTSKRPGKSEDYTGIKVQGSGATTPLSG